MIRVKNIKNKKETEKFLKTCDICGRSEIEPVIGNPSAELLLLQMDYLEEEGIYICADCKKKETDDVEQIPLFSEPMPDLKEFTPAAVPIVKKIYDRRISMREFAIFYDSALREYISDVFDVVRIDRLVKKRWGNIGASVINQLITGKEPEEKQNGLYLSLI